MFSINFHYKQQKYTLQKICVCSRKTRTKELNVKCQECIYKKRMVKESSYWQRFNGDECNDAFLWCFRALINRFDVKVLSNNMWCALPRTPFTSFIYTAVLMVCSFQSTYFFGAFFPASYTEISIFVYIWTPEWFKFKQHVSKCLYTLRTPEFKYPVTTLIYTQINSFQMAGVLFFSICTFFPE